MKNFNKIRNFNYQNEAGFSPEDSHLDWSDYTILKNQAKWDAGKQGNLNMNLDEIGTEYLRATAGLIAVMDGSAERSFRSNNIIREGQDNVEELKVFEKPPKPDHVIYLDKSARPVSWLVNLFWNDLASEGRKPDFSYLNIDRADFFPMIGIPTDNDGRHKETNEVLKPYHFDQKVKENNDAVKDGLKQIKIAIRSQYVDEKLIDPDGDIEEQILNLPTKLDGKNLLIIDETSRSGSTLHMAMRLLKIAIPELKNIQGEYFWGATVRDAVSNESAGAPVWYSSKENTGRGIGDRSDYYHYSRYDKNPSMKKLMYKMGSIAISAPLFKDNEGNLETVKDNDAYLLANDFKKLRSDFREGKVLFSPPMNYSDKKYVEVYKKQGFPSVVNEYGEEIFPSVTEELTRRAKK